MSPVDDARRLADLYPITETTSGQRFHDHTYCGGGRDCPHFALPRIVAALEAAERFVNATDGRPPAAYDEYLALVAALRGEGVRA